MTYFRKKGTPSQTVRFHLRDQIFRLGNDLLQIEQQIVASLNY